MSSKFHSVSFQAQVHHFILVKYTPFILDPFLHGILSQQLKNDFEIFECCLCRKIQVLLGLHSTYTDLNVHVIMFTQCYDVSNTDV